MIRFSIITCTYQAASVLQRTLDSVLHQSYSHLEHIILDGASTDDTVSMVKHYMEENEAQEDCIHDIIFTSERDNGLYDAMNKGIMKVTGDYLVFLNAGDVFPSPDTLEHIAGCVGEGETLPGVLYGDTDIVDNNGHFLRHRRLSAPKKLTWRSFRSGMLVCHQAFYARTDIAKQNLYNLHFKLSADVDWCIRVMKTAAQQHLPLRNVNAVIVNYLVGGLSIKNHRASLKERFRVMCQHYGFCTTAIFHVWFLIRSIIRK